MGATPTTLAETPTTGHDAAWQEIIAARESAAPAIDPSTCLQFVAFLNLICSIARPLYPGVADGRILAAQRLLSTMVDKGGLSAPDLAAESSAHGQIAEQINKQAEGIKRVGRTVNLLPMVGVCGVYVEPTVYGLTCCADAGRDE